MPSTLALGREEFIKGMSRDLVLSERPGILAVLDAMIAWSAERPTALRFRAEENAKGVVRFERVGSKVVFWSATPRRQSMPRLELLPGASRALPPERRAAAMDTINQHTRDTLLPTGKLYISFGALKNKAACAAVLKLMGELLEQT